MYQTSLWEPSEEDLFTRAVRQPHAMKIERAITLLRMFEPSALAANPAGYYVAFSGGKDSIVSAELCEMAGVQYTLNYGDTTIDPPELRRFIRSEYPQCIWHRFIKEPLPLYMAKCKPSGPPTRKSRWCCEVAKEVGGQGRVKITGVRALESVRRKGLWKEVNAQKDGAVVCPIVYWTESDVWNFIRARGLKYPALYDQGFTRLGCVGCGCQSSKGMLRDFARWPGYERLWKKGIERWHKRFKGATNKKGGEYEFATKFDTPEDVWAWWTSQEEDTEPDCQLYLW